MKLRGFYLQLCTLLFTYVTAEWLLYKEDDLPTLYFFSVRLLADKLSAWIAVLFLIDGYGHYQYWWRKYLCMYKCTETWMENK